MSNRVLQVLLASLVLLALVFGWFKDRDLFQNLLLAMAPIAFNALVQNQGPSGKGDSQKS